jgi:hypothetical protein
MNPELQDLYAGLSGFTLIPEKFELGRGAVVSRTYAHFMAPFLMAFAPPAPGKHHPGPWKPAKGGIAIDITAELFLPLPCRLDYMDRFNTVWWIVALLRLKATTAVFVPVVSSERFASVPSIQQEAELWPIEIHTRRLVPDPKENPRVDVSQLEWLASNWQDASELTRSDDFNLAFQAVDSSIWSWNPALALVGTWGALERLFSASHQELGFRVSANIAAYLEPPGRGRFKLFKQVKALYDQRSKAAHGNGPGDAMPYSETYCIARRVLLKMIEARHVPDKKELEAILFGDDAGIIDISRVSH